MKKFLNRIKSMSAGVLAMTMLLALQPTGLATAVAPLSFSDGFESGNFSAWTSHTEQWEVTSNNAHSGTYKAEVHGAAGGGSNPPHVESVLRKDLSTVGYEDVTLSYYYKVTGNLEADDHVYVEWFNGSSWIALHDYTDLNSDSNYNSASFAITGSGNIASFGIRFRAVLNAKTSDNFQLDDVSFGAAAVTTPTPTPSPSDTPTPTPTPSDTPTPTPSPSDTPTPTPSPSDTPTPTPSPSDTPTPTPPIGGGTRFGTLVIQKVIVGSSVSYSTFGFTFDGHDMFNADGINTYTRREGTYTVVEDPAEGFTTTYGGDCTADGVVTISGTPATCIITNTAVAPSESPTPTPGGQGGYNEPTPTPTPSETPLPTPSPTPTPTPVRVISRVNAGTNETTPTPSPSEAPLIASASNDQVAAAGVILGLDLCSKAGHLIWWLTLFAAALALLWFGRRRGPMFWLLIAYVVIWTLWAWTLCGFGFWWLALVLGIIVWLLSAPKNEK